MGPKYFAPSPTGELRDVHQIPALDRFIPKYRFDPDGNNGTGAGVYLSAGAVNCFSRLLWRIQR